MKKDLLAISLTVLLLFILAGKSSQAGTIQFKFDGTITRLEHIFGSNPQDGLYVGAPAVAILELPEEVLGIDGNWVAFAPMQEFPNGVYIDPNLNEHDDWGECSLSLRLGDSSGFGRWNLTPSFIWNIISLGVDSNTLTYFQTITEDLDAKHVWDLSSMSFGFGVGSGLDFSGSGTIDSVTVVPEPATMLLFCTGLAGLAGTRLRRKAKGVFWKLPA